MQRTSEKTEILKWTYNIYTGLILVWTIVWTLKVYLVDPRFEWFTTDAGGFVFWTVAKILIWVLPALWLIKLSGRSFKEVFNFANWKGWLVWGGGIGFLVTLTGFIPKYFSGQRFFPPEFSFALINVLIIAPIFEEFLIRGAILGNLRESYSFLTANIVSSVLFVGLHLPGWYFAGSLVENLTKPVGGALSILFLGLLFGYAVYRSKSVGGGMIAHFLNNLSSLR